MKIVMRKCNKNCSSVHDIPCPIKNPNCAIKYILFNNFEISK